MGTTQLRIDPEHVSGGGGSGSVGEDETSVSNANDPDANGAYEVVDNTGICDASGTVFVFNSLYRIYKRKRLLGGWFVVIFNGVSWVLYQSVTDPATWVNSGATTCIPASAQVVSTGLKFRFGVYIPLVSLYITFLI